MKKKLTGDQQSRRRRSPCTCICIFVKEPRAGLVKTRLAREVGDQAAVALYRALARDCLQAVFEARVAERRFLYSPGDRPPRSALDLLPRGHGGKFRYLPQGTGDLGERMARAADGAFTDGFDRVLLVGTDTPTLSAALLEAASTALGTSPVVLGPALDGGYYLLGLARPAPGLLRGIPWSTGDVLTVTLHKARAARLHVQLLAPLGDIDRWADVEALRRELAIDSQAPRGAHLRATRRALSRLRIERRP